MAKQTGKVYLVGAGPGDLGLVTLRARDLIAACDVLVYDYLANPKLKHWTREGCEWIHVGKQKGRHSIAQAAIEAILLEHAKKGKMIVRLKGGDPFVFGRGGEEARRLRDAGFDYEIVPAVTAAIGAAAYTGIPLTQRGVSSSVAFLTGHEDVEKHRFHVDFRAFAKSGGTLCLYMGVSTLERITAELMAGGLAPETPAAVVQWATLPKQRSLISTLGELVDAVDKAGLSAPSVIVVGEVVRCAGELDWFAQRPLFGKRVVVTRNRERASELATLLEAEGAEVLDLPLIAIREHVNEVREQEMLTSLPHYQWLVFTSPNGVTHFFRKFFALHKDLRDIGGVRIACIGEATAREVAKYHLGIDYVPPKATADALAKGLLETHDLQNYNVLLVTGNRNSDHLPKQLAEGQAIVDTLCVYETHLTDLSEDAAAEQFRAGGADAITFTSASTVENFVRQAEHLAVTPGARTPKLFSIGPQTSKRLNDSGLPLTAEASKANLKALVAVLTDHLAKQSNGSSS